MTRTMTMISNILSRNRYLLVVLVFLLSCTFYIFVLNQRVSNTGECNYTKAHTGRGVKKDFYVAMGNTLWGEYPSFSQLKTVCGDYTVIFTANKSIVPAMEIFFDPDIKENNWPEPSKTPEIPRILFTAEQFYYYFCANFEDCGKRFNWSALTNIAADIYIPYYREGNIRQNFYKKMETFDFYKDILKPKLQWAKKRKEEDGKAPIASWFTSFCNTPGSNRVEYISDMMNHSFSIDSYGGCLNNRQMDKEHRTIAHKLEMIRNYKFYFAFENSFTRGYITEKPFECLETGTVPVVMTHPFNRKYLPRGSYIFVGDFDSPIHLAQYLTYLSKNDTAYQEYFKWRTDKVVIEDWMKEMQFSSLPCSIVSLYERWKGGSLNQLQTVSVPQLQENILPRDFFFKNK